MDIRKLTEILQSSINPEQRENAEQQLAQAHKIIGFYASLLQMLMQNDIPLPVRQAGSVYFKNRIISGWFDKKDDDKESNIVCIHEQDRALIRDMIVDAIVLSPSVIRTQLCTCLKTIIKHDFPERWTRVVDKIHIYLQNPDRSIQMGALLATYQLIKCYECQPSDVRVPLIEAMGLILPMLYDLMVSLQPDQSSDVVLMQKQIVKCFYLLIKNILPLQLLAKPIFTTWMDVLKTALEQRVPEHAMSVDEDERIRLPWWKLKKWTILTLYRIFERYGSPVTAKDDYKEFAEWHLTTFTGGILETVLGILDQYRNGVFVSPRVLQHSLNYIDRCVSHSLPWKMIKPHILAIIEDVLFPIMSHSDSDEKLWQLDQQEYIRVKFDIFEDSTSPVTAAQMLLISVCKKRKNILVPTMQLCTKVLTSVDSESNQRKKDGAYHILGTLSNIIIKKYFQEGADSLFAEYVFREFNSRHGYMRARACWLVHCFAPANFKNEQTLIQATHLVIAALLRDSQLPVKVQAAMALQTLISSKGAIIHYVEPQIKPIVYELLEVIRQTENDEVTDVLQKIVPKFTVQLTPLALDIMEGLAETFSKIIDIDPGSDEKTVAGMSLLNVMETVLNVMEDNYEIMSSVEPIVLRVVGSILQQRAVDFIEEAMLLLCCLTSKNISPGLWSVLQSLYDMFDKEGIEFFTNIMPVLHNYITVDTKAFLAGENNFVTIFNMIKMVLASGVDEEAEVFAAKLLEVMVLQCSHHIKNCYPNIIELVLNRLTKRVYTSELRTMLLQVLIAIMFNDPTYFFDLMTKLQESVPDSSVIEHFIKQWIHDADCFVGLHDRKMCLLGICTLLEMGANRPNIDEVLPKIMPACLELFEGLKRAYEFRAECDDDSSSEGDNDDHNESLSSDEDELEHVTTEHMRHLAEMAAAKGIPISQELDDCDSDDDDYDEETEVECYTTPLDQKDCPIDEYVSFKNTLSVLLINEPAIYHSLLASLSEEQLMQLNGIMVLADQRKAQMESKRIEQNGGYSFTVPPKVPSTFNFGS